MRWCTGVGCDAIDATHRDLKRIRCNIVFHFEFYLAIFWKRSNLLQLFLKICVLSACRLVINMFDYFKDANTLNSLSSIRDYTKKNEEYDSIIKISKTIKISN